MLRKISLFLILFVAICIKNVGFAQKFQNFSEFGISKFEQEKIYKLHELIYADIDTALLEIKNYKKLNSENASPELKIEIQFLEFELYKSKANFIQAKLAFYEALAWSKDVKSSYHRKIIQFLKYNNSLLNNKKKGMSQKLNTLLKSCERGKNTFLTAKTAVSLGKLNSKLGQFNKAQAYFEKASLLYEKLELPQLYYDVKINKAITFFWEEKQDLAVSLFHETRSYFKEKKQSKCYANAILNISEAYLYMEGMQDSSFYYFKKFLDKKESADIRDIYNCYWSLEEYYLQKGNKDSAYYYLEKAYSVENEIKDQMQVQTNKTIDFLYHSLQNQRKLEDEGNHQKSLKIIFALGGLFLLCITVIISLVLKQKNKLNSKLLFQNDQIASKNKAIDQALKDKNILLKEIHHRVKNNLQIISSLLSLQAKSIDDEKAIEAINEGKERIQAIALIHQKLYVNNSFANINMKEYLSDLMEQIATSYGLNKIEINFKAHDIHLNIDTVVPLGLIICELVTNAYKYAFESNPDGQIKVDINVGENGYYVLNVKDNGVGMKPNFDFLKSNTLGVEIITALVEQLDGEISYKSDDTGTSVKVKFKEIQ